MRPASVIGVALLAAVASGVTTALMLPTDASHAAPAGEVDPDVLAGVERRQEALERSVTEMKAELAELGRQLQARNSGARTPVVTEGQLDEAVRRALEPAEQEGTTEREDRKEFDLQAVMRDLLDPQLSAADKTRIWEDIRDSGRIDLVLAELERLAERAPYDPEAKADLGTAYLNKMLTMGGGPKAGRWGAQAAATFGAALELDATHWRARFELAKHSYYAGLGGDAVKHFELLVEQQSSRAPQDKHAAVFLWLGNLHMDQGKAELAKAVWAEGLEFFPQDVALRERLDAFR